MYALGAERSDEFRPQGEVLLKTPTSQLAVNGGSQHPDKRKEGGHGPTLADEIEHLLPTPRASDGEKGGPNQRGSKGDLTMNSAVQLLPTPRVSDMNGAEDVAKRDSPQLRAVGQLLPTPCVSDSGNTPENHLRKKPGRSVVTSLQIITEYNLLPTGGRMPPQSTDGNKS